MYLAISKTAFGVLVEYAAYIKIHQGIQEFSEIVRACESQVLNDTVTCLRSGSSSQILWNAVTCSSFALHSLPGRQRLGFTPPTQDLGLGRLKHSRFRELMSKFLSIGEFTRQKKRKLPPELGDEAKKRVIEERDRAFPKCDKISLVRIIENLVDISREQSHEIDICARCRRLSQSTGTAILFEKQITYVSQVTA